MRKRYSKYNGISRPNIVEDKSAFRYGKSKFMLLTFKNSKSQGMSGECKLFLPKSR